MTRVIVEFDGKDVPPGIQGVVMLRMEQYLRDHGIDAYVEKRVMVDDSKLRLRMTDDERSKL